ncbi:MAG: isoprenylcysteine carboxylmethyltransferase family protein [Chloroflexi bacterium]|nr:isoprenylcysteine carboxylmethyltransferase family protein [Chloroflexota bacterium]
MKQQPESRGERWVVVQLILLSALLLAPAIAPERWSAAAADLARPLGLGIGALGALIVALAARYLGRNLTIFPKPKADGYMTDRGVYRFVRHPMYCGVILCALGWSLWQTSGAALVISAILLVFFDRKAAQEERWLQARYPEYAAYRRRVKKFLPFVC